MKVAVYGTLKRGHGNHRVMGDSKFLGTHVTDPAYTMYSTGGFPIVCTHGDTAIHVEVFEVEKGNLQRIYSLEGYTGIRNHKDNWYNTVEIQTPYGQAEMFVMSETKHLTKIESGLW